jgi:uncharacterized protein YecE (DUF72 family)
VFYPLSKVDELKFYSRYFNTVEINSTFYRPCNARTAESWARRTPDDFEFTVKAWQQFTHNREIWTPGECEEFKAGLQPLRDAGKFGCLLFQFPASFKADPQTTDRLKKLLELFEGFDKVVELRHQSWDESASLLGSSGAAPVFIDEPKFRTSIRQGIDEGGEVVYLRMHGRNFDKWWKHEHRNERYDYLYSAAELKPYAERLKDRLEHGLRRSYTFFNNHPGAKAVANAVMLHALLDVPVKEELPGTFVERFPEMQETISSLPDLPASKTGH